MMPTCLASSFEPGYRLDNQGWIPSGDREGIPCLHHHVQNSKWVMESFPRSKVARA